MQRLSLLTPGTTYFVTQVHRCALFQQQLHGARVASPCCPNKGRPTVLCITHNHKDVKSSRDPNHWTGTRVCRFASPACSTIGHKSLCAVWHKQCATHATIHAGYIDTSGLAKMWPDVSQKPNTSILHSSGSLENPCTPHAMSRISYRWRDTECCQEPAAKNISKYLVSCNTILTFQTMATRHSYDHIPDTPLNFQHVNSQNTTVQISSITCIFSNSSIDGANAAYCWPSVVCAKLLPSPTAASRTKSSRPKRSVTMQLLHTAALYR